MSILTADELTHMRQEAARGEAQVDWSKAQVNAAIQAIEDTFEAARPTINSAINAATSPLVLPASVKTKLVKHYLRQKFERGG